VGGAGAFTLQSNRAVAQGLSGKVDIVDAGVADCTVSATVQVVNGVAEAGLTFRWQDASNYWYVTGYAGDGKSYLYKVTGGTAAQITSGGSGVSNGVDFTLSVVLSGSSITVNVNGSLAYTQTDSAFSTATVHGLKNNSSHSNQWDDFTITTSGVAPAVSHLLGTLGVGA
jgi:hypothetical protein